MGVETRVERNGDIVFPFTKVAETKGQFKILSAAAGEREAESIDLKIKVRQGLDI